jgi:membrane protease YdiL (CAAX protease family)
MLVLIAVLSTPFYVLGLSDVHLMPGLPLSSLMFLSPAGVACWAAWRAGGLLKVRSLLGRILDASRAKPWTRVFASATLFPAVLVVEYALLRAIQLPLPLSAVAWIQAPVLFVLFFASAACEELAWSATLLGPFQRRLGTFRAGLLLGAFIAAWHVLPFWQAHPAASWVLGQSAFTVAFRVVVAWLYNVSGRSLFAAVVCHAGYNTAWQLFPERGSGYDPWATAALTWLVVALIVALYGTRTLGGNPLGE